MKIRVRKDKEDKGEFRGLLLSFLLFLAAAAAFGAGSLGFLNRTGQRSQETLRKAITRACIQCYAIEGRYPPSVEYLEENYGIQIDHDKYNVFYERKNTDRGTGHKRAFYHASVSGLCFMRPFFCSYGKPGI